MYSLMMQKQNLVTLLKQCKQLIIIGKQPSVVSEMSVARLIPRLAIIAICPW